MKRLIAYGGTLPALISCSWAHPGDLVLTPSNWPRAWSWEPAIVATFIASGGLYFFGLIKIYRRNPTMVLRPWQVICFCCGWLSLVVALISPLHKLGEVLFSAHMAQHEVLMVLAAPLLVLGRPLIAFLFAMPEAWRRPATAWIKRPIVKRTWECLTAPIVTWIIHGLAIWIWHIPALYEAAIKYEGIHALQHTMFLGTAILFWWTLIHGGYGRLGYGIGFVYVFTTALHTSLLGVLLTVTQQIWYPIYDGRTTSWNLAALEDQQLGGLIMWIPSGTIFVVIGLAMFAAWLRETERRESLSRLSELIQPELTPSEPCSRASGGSDAI